MKLNEVKFLQATNAVADVYTKATGMPIVGEMMAAAAGNGGEPNPFSNVVLNITEKDGEGNGTYMITFNSNYAGEISEMSVFLYGANDFGLEIVNFSPLESQKYTGTLFFDNSYGNIMEFPNGGNYEIQITNTGETFSGKWTLNDATTLCENVDFASIEALEIEETEEEGWVARATFDRDIREYGDYSVYIDNESLGLTDLYISNNILEVTDNYEYIGDNTFKVTGFEVNNPESGEFDDFTAIINIGKFGQCSEELTVIGTVTPILFTFTSITVIKNGVDDYTVEATSNKPAPVENARVYLEESGDSTNWSASISPTEEGSTHWVFNSEYEYSFNEGSIPTEGGECSAWGEFIEGDDKTIYGLNWIFEDQTQNEVL